MRRVQVLWLLVATLVVADALALVALRDGPSNLSFARPTAGAAQRGNVVLVEVRAPALAAGEYVAVFIDREVVAPGAPIPNQNVERMPASLRRRIVGLSLGEHRLTAIVVDRQQRRVGTDEATTTVRVRGPAVTARVVSRRVEAGKPVRVSARVEGATLVAPNGDTSGASGHLHVIVGPSAPKPGDRLTPGAGVIEATTTEFDIPPLPKGPHRIWIVLTHGDHVVMRPLSLAELAVLVE